MRRFGMQGEKVGKCWEDGVRQTNRPRAVKIAKSQSSFNDPFATFLRLPGFEMEKIKKNKISYV